MPLTAFALVLLGAVIHAGWNLVAKKAGGDARFTFFSGGLMALVWAPVGVTMGWSVVPQWGALEWGVVAASGFLHWVYFICLLTGYRKSDLSVVYPLARGSGPLVSSLVAVVLFGERISLLGMGGILGVVLGVFLIAGGPALWRAATSKQGLQEPAAQERIKAGVFWGLLTGSLIAAYAVLDAWAVKVLALSPIVFDYFCNLVRLPWASVAFFRNVAEGVRLFRLQWKHALVVAVASPVAYVMVLYAMRLAPVSHVAPAREVSMLFAAWFGGQLLGEGDRAARMAGAVLIAAGVIALALG